ncbi:MAG: alpha/beta hydrolase [Acidimicrobiia bacterium]
MHYIEATGGVRLAADSWGPASGAPVLLLHGGGQTRHAWGGTGEALGAAGFRATAFDARGHGDSDWAPDADYRLDRLVADLFAVVATCERPPAVVGASVGGIAGLLAAGEHPGGVDAANDPAGRGLAALVMVDAAARLEVEGAVRIREFMTAQPDGFADLEAAAAAIAAFMPHRPPPTDPSGLAKNLRQDADGRWRWHWDPALMNGPHTMRGALDSARLEAAARHVRIPTLLVRGRLSDVISEAGAREFRELIPHAEFTDVSDAGHMVAGDRNDVFTAAVVDFLRRVLAP